MSTWTMITLKIKKMIKKMITKVMKTMGMMMEIPGLLNSNGAGFLRYSNKNSDTI